MLNKGLTKKTSIKEDNKSQNKLKKSTTLTKSSISSPRTNPNSNINQRKTMVSQNNNILNSMDPRKSVSNTVKKAMDKRNSTNLPTTSNIASPRKSITSNNNKNINIPRKSIGAMNKKNDFTKKNSIKKKNSLLKTNTNRSNKTEKKGKDKGVKLNNIISPENLEYAEALKPQSEQDKALARLVNNNDDNNENEIEVADVDLEGGLFKQENNINQIEGHAMEQEIEKGAEEEEKVPQSEMKNKNRLIEVSSGKNQNEEKIKEKKLDENRIEPKPEPNLVQILNDFEEIERIKSLEEYYKRRRQMLEDKWRCDYPKDAVYPKNQVYKSYLRKNRQDGYKTSEEKYQDLKSKYAPYILDYNRRIRDHKSCCCKYHFGKYFLSYLDEIDKAKESMKNEKKYNRLIENNNINKRYLEGDNEIEKRNPKYDNVSYNSLLNSIDTRLNNIRIYRNENCFDNKINLRNSNLILRNLKTYRDIRILNIIKHIKEGIESIRSRDKTQIN